MAGWLHSDLHRFDPISENDYLNMDNRSFNLEPGTVLHRMVDKPYKSLRDQVEYVSFGEDSERYKGFLPKMWAVNGRDSLKNSYQMVLSNTSKIKAPGKKDTFDLMTEVYSQLYKVPREGAHKYMLYNFNRYTLNLIDRNDPFNKVFYSALEISGYNAVIDWNDAGRLSENPLIMIKPARDLKVNNVIEVSKQEIIDTFNNISPVKSYVNFSRKDFDSELNKFDYFTRDKVLAYMRTFISKN